MIDPNRVLLQSRLNAYNTALGREMASHLNGYDGRTSPMRTALGLIDELLDFWEKHHAPTPPSA